VKEKTLNPKWKECRELGIKFYKYGQVDPLLVEVWDHDALSDDTLGQCKIDVTGAVTAPC
jgi:Ca2+-dependent lipid-binding protein